MGAGLVAAIAVAIVGDEVKMPRQADLPPSRMTCIGPLEETETIHARRVVLCATKDPRRDAIAQAVQDASLRDDVKTIDRGQARALPMCFRRVDGRVRIVRPWQ